MMLAAPGLARPPVEGKPCGAPALALARLYQGEPIERRAPSAPPRRGTVSRSSTQAIRLRELLALPLTRAADVTEECDVTLRGVIVAGSFAAPMREGAVASVVWFRRSQSENRDGPYSEVEKGGSAFFVDDGSGVIVRVEGARINADVVEVTETEQYDCIEMWRRTETLRVGDLVSVHGRILPARPASYRGERREHACMGGRAPVLVTNLPDTDLVAGRVFGANVGPLAEPLGCCTACGAIVLWCKDWPQGSGCFVCGRGGPAPDLAWSDLQQTVARVREAGTRRHAAATWNRSIRIARRGVGPGALMLPLAGLCLVGVVAQADIALSGWGLILPAAFMVIVAWIVWLMFALLGGRHRPPTTGSIMERLWQLASGQSTPWLGGVVSCHACSRHSAAWPDELVERCALCRMPLHPKTARMS